MQMSDDFKKISVISNNQSGGITAYSVNIAPQERKLDSRLMQQLDDLLSGNSGKKISVTAIMGDQEAFQFATQIQNYLVSKGHNPDGVNQAVYTQPVKGQIVEQNENAINFIIGAR